MRCRPQGSRHGSDSARVDAATRTARRPAGIDEAAHYSARVGHDAGRLLYGVARRSQFGPAVPRHFGNGSGGGGRKRAESVFRTGSGRADGAHEKSAVAGRAAISQRGDNFFVTHFCRRNRLPCGFCKCSYRRPRSRNLGGLHSRVHAAQDANCDVHFDRRLPRRCAAAYGLDGRTRRNRRRRALTVCHSVPLADAALFCDRMDLYRRLRARRLFHIWKRTTDGAADHFLLLRSDPDQYFADILRTYRNVLHDRGHAARLRLSRLWLRRGALPLEYARSPSASGFGALSSGAAWPDDAQQDLEPREALRRSLFLRYSLLARESQICR